ncbi:hypothetical protein [Chryseobacterium sp.]|uniref:hypothetical protein n=1 Tax=Chryseobacterium sp. TaxID=1871047 RepID=UPI0028A276BD|nr:hypothetical protein [Chryseobacterium sp.]
MKKFLLLLGLQFGCCASSQLLTINTLQNLSSSDIKHLDDKLSLHFDLFRHPDEEEKNVRVYSNLHRSNEKTIVLTVFLKNSGCHVFSVVSHVENEVLALKEELLKNNFDMGNLKAADGVSILKYDKNKHRFLIKEPTEKMQGHQVVFMCRE